MEDTFPWALINEINERGGESVKAEAVSIGAIRDDGPAAYDLVLDRISHEVPFYRTWLKCEAAKGAVVVNNPFWWSADDKFFDNVVAERAGVAVPKTVLLPHKQHPPNTESKSFRNMRLVEWDELFDYVGFPLFMKPAYGGGWRDVYKCHNREEFFAAYDQTRDLTMMAQEAIEFDKYYRCWVMGRSRARVMEYDPKAPFHERYVRSETEGGDPLIRRVHDDALRLCRLLGYDMNTVELAVRDGVPYAIDFMNSAPDADVHSVGEENFRWIVSNMAEFLIDRVLEGTRFELTGDWPETMQLTGASASPPAAARAQPTAPPRPKRASTRPAKSETADKTPAPRAAKSRAKTTPAGAAKSPGKSPRSSRKREE